MNIKSTNFLVILLTALAYAIVSMGFAQAQSQNCLDGDVNCTKGTSVAVTLNSNLIGHINLISTSGDTVITGGIVYIKDPNIVVNIETVTDRSIHSTYTLTGEIEGEYTGEWTGNYNYDIPIIVDAGDGLKYVGVDFETLRGIYHTGKDMVYVDNIGPSSPQISYPNGTTLYNFFEVQWTGVTDAGVGLSHYIFHLALDPGFESEVEVLISGNLNEYQLSGLPPGTSRWYLEAVDYLGNSSYSNVFFFHNALPSFPAAWGIYIPIPLTPYYTPIPNAKYIVVTIYNPKKILNVRDDIVSMLLQNFANSKASSARILPLQTPKTGVDAEDLTRQVNIFITNLYTLQTSPIRYQITLALLFVLLAWLLIRKRF